MVASFASTQYRPGGSDLTFLTHKLIHTRILGMPPIRCTLGDPCVRSGEVVTQTGRLQSYLSFSRHSRR